MAKTLEERILARCQKAVAKFNAEYNAFAEEFGDREVLVDEERSFYCLVSDLELVQDEEDKLWRLDCDGFLSDPIYIYDEEDGECYDNTGDGYWGDGFRACMNMYKKDLRRGRRFMAMPTEQIDAIQDGEIEDTDED